MIALECFRIILTSHAAMLEIVLLWSSLTDVATAEMNKREEVP